MGGVNRLATRRGVRKEHTRVTNGQSSEPWGAGTSLGAPSKIVRVWG